MRLHITILAASLSLAACGDDDGGDDGGNGENEPEVISRVTLTLTPEGGGDPVTAAFDDPDGDGGDPATVDPLNLAADTTYTMAVTFENALEDPPEDITAEVADESDEHQVFFTGSAVSGPASEQADAPLTHTYADTDGNGLPIGLENTIVTQAGSGELTVTLRHLPPVNDTPVKTEELAQEVIDGGFGALAGSTDAEVDFAVTVE
jgi:hypothetical protein